MKTDDLIAMLATNAEPASYRVGRDKLFAAAGLGTLGAFVLMYFSLGLRPDLGQAVALPMFWVKLGFPAVVAIFATLSLVRIGSPGMQLGMLRMGLALPLVVLWAMAILVLANASPETRPALIFGSTWTKCAFSIAGLAVPTWLAAFWAMKQFAPTQLRQAGAVAGLFAGAAAATVYALHCPEMQAPFLAIWYVLGILLPTVIGWAAGPKLLHW
jgi:hypothetical protein